MLSGIPSRQLTLLCLAALVTLGFLVGFQGGHSTDIHVFQEFTRTSLALFDNESEVIGGKYTAQVEIPKQSQHNVTKRAPVLAWDDALATGCMLMDLMSLSPSIPPISRFTNIEDLDRYGWEMLDQGSNPSDVFSIRAALKSIGVIDDIGLYSGRKISWEHLNSYDGEDGEVYPPTLADYTCSYAVRSGFLDASFVYGPAHKGSEQVPPVTRLPELKALSDVMFLQWQALCGKSKVSPKTLKYYLSSFIVNETTNRIIEEALRRVGKPYPPAKWPGTTFLMTGDEGKAILATPNGRAIAWFLAQHKTQLGNKSVKQVTVFRDDTMNGIPFALFEIEELTLAVGTS
ncbi:hypothetical protein LTR50_001604 [Elasticomyces elasticus]|nr:hypothetical protein LTR50_001604 [Elasticomyces elasticus]